MILLGHAGGTAIMEANLDGSGVTALVSGQQVGQTFPVGVAVDSSHVYWTTVLDGTVNEANLDGTGVTTLVFGQVNPLGWIVVGP